MTGRRAPATLVVTFLVVACARSPGGSTRESHRVVSLGPNTTETMFAIGAGDRLVARSRFCDWPPQAAALPAVGGIEPDIEAILALNPDLVVGPSGQWSTHLTETMKAHGIATWFPDEIQLLAGVDALITGLGQRTGHGAEAHDLVAAIDARERSLEAAVAGAPRPRVLLVAGLAPIVVAGPRSFASDMVGHAGATNVVTEGGAWPTLDFESVIDLDPDVILDASVAETGGVTHITSQAQGWGGVRAVREGHVVPVGDERVLRPGPRIAEGLAVLVHAVHPEASIP